MPYELKPLSCNPAGLNGLSEKLIVSHWENNYGGAVKRLNAIEQKLAELQWASAPVFEINGLKREEMIASGSMILHEVYFDSLGGAGGGSPWKRSQGSDRTGFRFPRRLARRVHRHGQGPRWWLRLDPADLEPASCPPGQRLGRRPRPQPARRHAADHP